jgi:hypothetical protein
VLLLVVVLDMQLSAVVGVHAMYKQCHEQSCMHYIRHVPMYVAQCNTISLATYAVLYRCAAVLA